MSLWQNNTDATEDIASQLNTSYEVVIAGGGITGITTGLLLQKAGKKVLIAEAHSACFGTTGGTTAHLNTFMDTPYYQMISDFGKKEAMEVAKAIQSSLNLIRSNVNEYNISCGFKDVSAYIYAENADQEKELDKIYEGTLEVGVHVEQSNKAPIPIAFTRSLKFDGQATFHPTRYVMAILKEFIDRGGTFLDDCRVTSVDEGSPHIVHTSKGKTECVHFVYATHIPPGVNLLHFRCAPYRSYALALKLNDDSQYPDALVYDSYEPYHYFRTQEVDGEKYLIAGGEDHKTGHEPNTMACFNQLESYVRAHFSVKETAYKWSSQYFEPVDGLPYIGRLPGAAENMYVATGFGGNGMIYSGVAALLLRDVIIHKHSPVQKLFDPNRVKLVAGFSNFVKEAADVIGLLANKLLPTPSLDILAELSPDEGRVVKLDGQKVAIYKDASGNVHPLHAACTHIKCDVVWNNAERSWDCPCHGSRFGIDGTMLTGPGRKDLEKILL